MNNDNEHKQAGGSPVRCTALGRWRLALERIPKLFTMWKWIIVLPVLVVAVIAAWIVEGIGKVGEWMTGYYYAETKRTARLLDRIYKWMRKTPTAPVSDRAKDRKL
jgi:hypothetical protein